MSLAGKMPVTIQNLSTLVRSLISLICHKSVVVRIIIAKSFELSPLDSVSRRIGRMRKRKKRRFLTEALNCRSRRPQ